MEAVVNFYQIGFLPHKESPPGTFQPLSPSRGLATQLQHILSGLEFSLFQYFHFSLLKSLKLEDPLVCFSCFDIVLEATGG